MCTNYAALLVVPRPAEIPVFSSRKHAQSLPCLVYTRTSVETTVVLVVTPPSQKCASVPRFELQRSRDGSPTVMFTPLERCQLGTEWKLFLTCTVST